jgi:serine/threonine protein kinase
MTLCTQTQGGGMLEETARPLFQQLMTALEYCHSIGIANRDVKVSTC